MAAISQNQSTYLNNLVKAGGGNAAWATAQLKGATVNPAPVAAKPVTSPVMAKPVTPVTSPVMAKPATPVTPPVSAKPLTSPLSASEVQKQMAANSAAWSTATPQMQTQLHQANLDLAKQTGQSYNATQGTYSAPVAAKPATPVTPNPATSTGVDPVLAQQYAAAAEAFKQQHWYNGGTTATPLTESQNLAAVINQPGNTVKNNPTPFISGILNQAQKDTAAQQGSVPTATPQSIQTAQPTLTAAPVSASQSTGNQSGYPGGLTTAQINADAAARMAKQRAGIEGAVTAGKAARKSLFDYNAKNTNDSRVLENSQNARTLSPFSGKTGYLQGQIERGRGIDDTFTNQNYTNDVNALDAQLTSFDAMAPEQQQALYDQLVRQERDYGLQEGALTGQFQGSQTLAARTADQNYQLGLSGLSGQLPGGGGQTLAAQGQQFNQGMAQKGANWNAYKDAVDMTGNLGSGPKSNWALLPGQTGQPSYPAQQQNIQNTAQYTGYYQGMPTMQKIMNDNTIKNMTADNLRQAGAEARAAGNQQLATKFDIWDRTGKAPDGIPGVTPGTALPGKTPTTLKESDIADLIDRSPYIQKQYDEQGRVIGSTVDPAQKQALSQYIASLGLPPDQAKQWFIRYGLWSPSGN